MYSSAGAGVGMGVMTCSLEELECKNGFRTIADYDGIFYGATVGAVPMGMTYSTMIFDVYGVDSLAGRASISTHTTAFILGVSFGQICLGSGCTDFDMAPVIGFDASFDAFDGYGHVSNKSLKCCDN